MKPVQVAAYVKSETHSIFGAGTRNWRLTFASGQGVFLYGTVVRWAYPLQ